MPAIIYKKNVEDLEGHEPFGSGECVALPQGVTEIGHTSRWYPGSRVLDLAYLNPGTVIANFVFSKPGVGRFPNRHGFHAGLFMHFGPRSMATGENVSIVAMDQWVYRTFDEGFPADMARQPNQVRLVGDRIDILPLTPALGGSWLRAPSMPIRQQRQSASTFKPATMPVISTW